MTTEGLKGIVHPKMKILSWFTHPHAIPDVYDFLALAEHKQRLLEHYHSSVGPYNVSEWVTKLWSFQKHIKAS